MKTVTLTKGYTALVDDEDYDYLSQWTWYASIAGKRKNGTDRVYACRNAKGKSIYMHVEILKKSGITISTSRKTTIDHEDQNTLNNQKENLVQKDHADNLRNRKKYKRFDMPLGVRKTRNGKYEAHTSVKRKWIQIGTFDTPDEAKEAYDLWILNELENLRCTECQHYHNPTAPCHAS